MFAYLARRINSWLCCTFRLQMKGFSVSTVDHPHTVITIITIITLYPEDKVMEFPHKASKRLDLSNLSTSSSTLSKRTNPLSISL